MKRTPYQFYLTTLAMFNLKNSELRDLLEDASPEESVAVALGTTNLPIMTEVELIGAVQKSLVKQGYSVVTLSVEGEWEPDALRMQFQCFLNYGPGFNAQFIADKLNELLSIDREGVSRLLMTRHKVAHAVADHPSVIASPEGEVGALGLINGLLPKESDGRGALEAVLEIDTQLVQRVRMASDKLVEVPAAAKDLDDDGCDWTGEIKICVGDRPTKGAIVGKSMSLQGDLVEILVGEDPLLFNRRSGQCVSAPQRGVLWVSPEEMYRVHPDTYLRRQAAAHIPTPCLDPEKMHGFCDQQGGTDDPTA